MEKDTPDKVTDNPQKVNEIEPQPAGGIANSKQTLSQETVPPIQTSPTTAPEPKKKTLALIIGVVVLILLLITTGFYIYRNNQLNRQNNTQLLTPSQEANKKTSQTGVGEKAQIITFDQQTGNPLRIDFVNGAIQKNNIGDEKPLEVGISKDQKVFFIISKDGSKLTIFDIRGNSIGSYQVNKSLTKNNVFIVGDTVLVGYIESSEFKDPACDGLCPRINNYSFYYGSLKGEIKQKFTQKLDSLEITGILWYDTISQDAIIGIHGEPSVFTYKLNLKTGELKKLSEEGYYCIEANNKNVATVSMDNNKLEIVDFTGLAKVIKTDEGKDIGCPVLDEGNNLLVRIKGSVYRISPEDGKLTQEIEISDLRNNFPGYGFDLISATNGQYLFRLDYNHNEQYVYLREDKEPYSLALINWKVNNTVGFLSPSPK